MQQGIQVKWAEWQRLFLLPSFPQDEGVYVVRRAPYYDNPMRDLYVGQGAVRERLLERQSDPDMREEEDYYGRLWVTWANVASSQRAGVERFLADNLDPAYGERHPDVPPIPVNLPEWP